MAEILKRRRRREMPSVLLLLLVAVAAMGADGSQAMHLALERRAQVTGAQGAGSVAITVLYDNREFVRGLGTDWGFAALVELPSGTYLWDTGGDGPTLLGNMDRLGVQSDRIVAVLLSHEHGDHTGGLVDFLAQGVRPPVYLLPSFTSEFRGRVGELTEVITVQPGMHIGSRVITTGEVSGPVAEQALIVETDSGLVVITGCAHPGVVRLVERARELVDEPVYLVLGGFHMRDQSPSDIAAAIAELKRIGVQRVGPTHCTGDGAIDMFRAEYGEAFVEVGVGQTIRVGGG